MSVKVIPKRVADRETLAETLRRISGLGDHWTADPDGWGAILWGRDEAHLDHLLERLLEDGGIALDVRAPEVAYVETVSGSIGYSYVHRPKSGPGAGDFASVMLKVEPVQLDGRSIVDCRESGVDLSDAYLEAVWRGFGSVLEHGPCQGSPVVDLKVSLIGAERRDGSSATAFEIAGRMGLREALKAAGLKLREPVMRVDVATPARYAEGIAGDLISRRGTVRRSTTTGNRVEIEAVVPAANLFGYVNALRSFSEGLATFSAVFDHYADVWPPEDPDDRGPMAAALRP